MGFLRKTAKKVAKTAAGAMDNKSGSVGMLAMLKKPGNATRSKGMGPIGKLMSATATKTPMFKKGGAVSTKTGKGKAMGVATRGGGRALMKGK